MSTQWAGAKLLEHSGDAEFTQTPMAARQSEFGISFHAHHTYFICDKKKGITITN